MLESLLVVLDMEEGQYEKINFNSFLIRSYIGSYGMLSKQY